MSVSADAIYLTGYSGANIDGSTTAYDSGIFLSSFALNGNLNFLKIISQSVLGSGYTKTSVDKDNYLYAVYKNNLADMTQVANIVKINVLSKLIWKKIFWS